MHSKTEMDITAHVSSTLHNELSPVSLFLSVIPCLASLPLKDPCLALAGVVHMVRASSHKLKGHGFNSRSGHMLRLLVLSLVGVQTRGNRCFSPFVSPSLKSISMPLGEKKKRPLSDHYCLALFFYLAILLFFFNTVPIFFSFWFFPHHL